MATRKKRVRSPKYKVGDMVYSYQNPTVKRRISHFRDSGVEDGVDYGFKYKIALYRQNGSSYSSNWINQSSIRKTKPRKK